MNFLFDQEIATQYHSTSQKIRVMSENWVENNIFCPCCGNLQILRLANNKPVADFQCENCNSIFELKSKQGKFGKKIVDGAYSTWKGKYFFCRCSNKTRKNFIFVS